MAIPFDLIKRSVQNSLYVIRIDINLMNSRENHCRKVWITTEKIRTLVRIKTVGQERELSIPVD